MKIIKNKLNNSASYVLLDINTFKIGETTAFDIYIKKDRDYVIIIEAGTLLTENIYIKLRKQEKLFINKKDEDKEILSCENLKYYIRHNKDNYNKRVNLLYEVNDQLFDFFLSNKENKIHLECVKLIVQSIIFLIRYDELFVKNTMPHLVSGYKLNNHSLHVAIYALTLGNKLKLNNEKLLQLGVAALLHDVGLKNIDEKIISKNDKLTQSEMKLVQKHPLYSIEILKQNKITDHDILDAVLHHHERYNGSGYPTGLRKTEISSFASILAICDVFDALTNNRPHRKEYKSFEALKIMMKGSEMVNQFNQEYLQMSIKML